MRTFDIEYRKAPDSALPDRTIRLHAELVDDAWDAAKERLREDEWQITLVPIYAS